MRTRVPRADSRDHATKRERESSDRWTTREGFRAQTGRRDELEGTTQVLPFSPSRNAGSKKVGERVRYIRDNKNQEKTEPIDGGLPGCAEMKHPPESEKGTSISGIQACGTGTCDGRWHLHHAFARSVVWFDGSSPQTRRRCERMVWSPRAFSRDCAAVLETADLYLGRSIIAKVK